MAIFSLQLTAHSSVQKLYDSLILCQICLPNVLHLLEGRKEMFYLTTHSTHFIYGYMASDIW